MRRSGLHRDPDATREWQEKSRRAPARGTSLSHRPKRLSKGDRAAKQAAAGRFRDEVLRDPCLVCGTYDDRDAHHAVPAQVLRRICRSLALEGAAAYGVIYLPAIGVALCGAGTQCRAHERHTTRTATIGGERLPERVAMAADELGPEAVAALEREHPTGGVAR